MKWPGWLAPLLCGVMFFIWIPLDVETGIIEKVHRQVIPGDAFAPAIAAVIIGLGGLLILLERSEVKSEDLNQTAAPSERSLRPPGNNKVNALVC